MDKQEQKLSLRRKVLVSIAILPAIALFVFSLASLIGVTISLPPSGEERSSGQAMIFISAVMIFLSCVGALSVIMLGWRHDRS